MYKSSLGMSGALWLAAGLKVGITVMWLCWKKDPSENADDEEAGSTLPV